MFRSTSFHKLHCFFCPRGYDALIIMFVLSVTAGFLVSSGVAASTFSGFAAAGRFNGVSATDYTDAAVGYVDIGKGVASVGDWVWLDLDQNGIQDAGEPGFAWMPVLLYDENLMFLVSVLTDSGGFYTFGNLGPGAYNLQFLSPLGYSLSAVKQGSDGSVDSDPDRTTGLTGPILLGDDENNVDIDAGVVIGCAGPVEPVFLFLVDRYEGLGCDCVDGCPRIHFADPNQPDLVTGYNIYRSNDPGIMPKTDWPLVAHDVVDMDEGLLHTQWIDTSCDPAEVWYYHVTAFNSICNAEGPTDFSYPGTIDSVVPDIGPFSGGSEVIISGSLLGSGSDIVSVTICGVHASIIAQTAAAVTVITGAGSLPGSGDVVVTSLNWGTTTAVGAFTYREPGMIDSISPDDGPFAGGTEVVISGSYLGSGSDIVSVTICGVDAAIIAQTVSSVTVITGAGSLPGSGDVVITSLTQGTTTAPDGFLYLYPGVINSVSPDTGPFEGGTEVVISGGYLGSGSDIVSVTIRGVVASIVSQTASSVTVITGAAMLPGMGDVVVNSVDWGTTTASDGFFYLYPGAIESIEPDAGPIAGGTEVVISGDYLGSGSDIVSVELCGVEATIVAQTASSVTVITGAAATPSTGDVLVDSLDWGPTTAIEAFTYLFNTGDLYSPDPIVGPMRYIPVTGPDGFVQGSPADEFCRFGDEDQFNHVLTREIVVMETEVTRQMWADLKTEKPSLPKDPTNALYGAGMSHPVQRVTWFEALLFANLMAEFNGLTPCYYTDASFTTPIDESNYTTGPFYCNFPASGYHLLSEGEWEYVARAGTTGPFSCPEPAYDGENCTSCEPGEHPTLNDHAVFCQNDTVGSEPVGSRLSNPWNLKDMHGNVWEWCWDWHAPYPADVTDYSGPADGWDRLIRGGSWIDDASVCRSAVRFSVAPSFRYIATGFRLARTVCSYQSSIDSVEPVKGPLAGGTPVLINGSYLGTGYDIVSVTFGGVEASILEQTTSSVTVITGPASSSGMCDVVVTSVDRGVATAFDAFTFLDPGVIASVEPDSGPFAGGTEVTINGSLLGSGDDIVSVTVAGAEASIVSQTSSSVTVMTGIGTTPGLGDVVVTSLTRGTMTAPDAFFYLYAGAITSVEPDFGPYAGGTEVTVSGIYIGSGTDIVSVTFCGVEASILEQTASSVTVITAANAAPDLCDVSIVSLEWGTTTAVAAFAYLLNSGDVYSIDPIVDTMLFIHPTGPDGFVQGSPTDESCRFDDEAQFTHILTRKITVMETEISRQMWADLKAVQTTLPDDPSFIWSGQDLSYPVQQVTWSEAILFANLLSLQNGLTRCYYKDPTFAIPVDATNYSTSGMYCNFTASGYRLPSQGEWEYATRAGTTTTFSCPEDKYIYDNCWFCVAGTHPTLEQHAVYCANSGDRTAPIGSKAPNPWNLKDVHGNVWEWVWDAYEVSYPSGTVTDYTGPTSGSGRRIRGGGWNNYAYYCRSAKRVYGAMSTRLTNIGFRLVRTVN